MFGKPKLAKPNTDAIREDSSYVEFAWEFLRRNRFYQAMIDGKENSEPAKWGFEWHPDVPRDHGLLNRKPYSETHEQGEPPQWRGLDDFAERLPKKASLKKETVEVELRPGQVLVVYDLSGFIYGQSPLSPQLWAAEAHLEKLSRRPFAKDSFSGKPMHREVLLRRLRLFDKIDAGIPLYDACKQLGYKFRSDQPFEEDVMHRIAHGLGKSKRPDPVTTAYEDLDAAYSLVYRHGYLAQLLGEKSFSLQEVGGRRALVPDPLISARKSSASKTKKTRK